MKTTKKKKIRNMHKIRTEDYEQKTLWWVRQFKVFKESEGIM